MKKLISVIAVAATLTASSAFAADSAMKVGVVDYLKVFKQVPQGQAKLDAMKADLKPKIEKLQTSQHGLAAEVKTLERNAPTMTKTARASKEKQLAKEQQAFQKQVMELRSSEMQKEQAAAATFEKDLKISIDKIGAAGHYSMIMNQQATPYVDAKYDVTAAVVTDMKKLA